MAPSSSIFYGHHQKAMKSVSYLWKQRTSYFLLSNQCNFSDWTTTDSLTCLWSSPSMKIANSEMPRIGQILLPYQPWFMIISCDEFVVERHAKALLPSTITCTQTIFPIMKMHQRKKILCTTIYGMETAPLFLEMYIHTPLFVPVVLIRYMKGFIVIHWWWSMEISFNESFIVIAHNHWSYPWKHWASTVNVIS